MVWFGRGPIGVPMGVGVTDYRYICVSLHITRGNHIQRIQVFCAHASEAPLAASVSG